MARNYSLPTIKTLFGEASACAYPDCGEGLIFRDRGASTVVAQIAHIRSERPLGPRHDPDFVGDIDGPENLLLLCGKHHPPVDRHESIYTIEELERWKAAQRERAGNGTPITDEQAQAFVRLSAEESQALAQVARLAQRVFSAVEDAHTAIGGVEDARESARRELQSRLPPMWEVDEDTGKRTYLKPHVRLPPIEDRVFDEQLRVVVESHRGVIREALNVLSAEIAVLQMIGGAGLADRARAVQVVAGELPARVANDPQAAATELRVALARLWSAAQGTDES